MTYAIAIIRDDTIEQPLIVFDEGQERVAHMVAVYLRAARPLMAPDGKRLEVPVSIDGSWYDWLFEALEDLEDVAVEIYDTDSGDLMAREDFYSWVQENQTSISRQHASPVEDVTFLDEHADKL